MGEIKGVIYPVLPKHLQRIFAGKDIFCKFIGKGKSGTATARINPGQKILFYSSRGDYEIVGEAKIDHLEYLTPDEVIRKYRDRLFISREELDDYVSRRKRAPETRLLVLILKQVRKYHKPYKLNKPITMAGMKLTDDMYTAILSHTK